MSKENKANLNNADGAKYGIVGLFANILLATVKAIFALITGSIALLSDAVNNITDSVSSLITIAAFKLSGRAADKEHPHGHGRYEYISGLLVSVIIIFVGVEFFKTSIERLINPSLLKFDFVIFIVLAVCVIVKIFMVAFYRRGANRLNSVTLKAASFDSLTDVIITSIIMIGFVVSMFTSFPVDAVLGIIMAVFFVFTGIRTSLETINRLLGECVDEKTKESIVDLLFDREIIIGVHELRVHDYGAGRMQGSVRVEVDKTLSLEKVHSVLDEIEQKAFEQYHIELNIHCDPIDVTSPLAKRVRAIIDKDIKSKYGSLNFHNITIDQSDEELTLEVAHSYGTDMDARVLESEIEAVLSKRSIALKVKISLENE